MVASRNRPEGGLGTPFGLGVLMLLLLSSEVGRQDLAALLARQPIVDRSQKAAFASPFGTILEAKFRVAHAMGDSIPLPLDFKLIGFDPNDPGVTGSIRERFLGEETFFASPYAGPMVDRSRKGDYGVAGGGDRLIALKGARLKSAPPIAHAARTRTAALARSAARRRRGRSRANRAAGVAAAGRGHANRQAR